MLDLDVRPPAAGAARADEVIRTERLSKRYGPHRALTEVDLVVRRGEVFGYLGPNGAGKTTTIRVLLGFLRPTSGRAEVFGLDSWADSARIHADLGYVPGDVAFWERMTGRELLTHLARLRGGVDLAYAHDVAARLDVDLRRPLRTLSKGNRQKIAIVQALMSRPSLLVLDEPTSGLDPLVQQQVQDMVREHAGRGGTVLLSSHMLSEVQRIADRVGIIRGGRLVAVERLADLRAKSLHHVAVHFAAPVEAAMFTRIEGVRDVVVHDHLLTCAAPQAALDDLLKAVATRHIVDLSCEEASLEETFLAYYGPGAPDAA